MGRRAPSAGGAALRHRARPQAGRPGPGVLALGQGHRLHELASLFTAAPEFQAKYGALDDAAFVAQLYRNALDREGEREGLDFWTAALEQHRAERSDIVVGFSESAEHAAKVTAADHLA